MAAITMFSRAAALEAKREGVRINVVTPSLINNTPGAELIFDDPFSAKLFEKAAAMAQLGVPEPDDLADTIPFLAGRGDLSRVAPTGAAPTWRHESSAALICAQSPET